MLGCTCLFKLGFLSFLDIRLEVGLLNHMATLLLVFLRNFYTTVHRGYTNLQTHQHHRRVPFSPHHLQHSLFVDFLTDGHFNRYEMVLHCIFDLHFANN